mmetsp:Transcript_138520/g.430780  ORF Transcript_138520/g.430780 Transcript_138520/m.430780 type:complete len:357 (-) Transcript_138520:472-1542(-)
MLGLAPRPSAGGQRERGLQAQDSHGTQRGRQPVVPRRCGGQRGGRRESGCSHWWGLPILARRRSEPASAEAQRAVVDEMRVAAAGDGVAPGVAGPRDGDDVPRGVVEGAHGGPELSTVAATLRVHGEDVPHALEDVEAHLGAVGRRLLGDDDAVAQDGLGGPDREVQRRHAAASELLGARVHRRGDRVLQQPVVPHVLLGVQLEAALVDVRVAVEDDVADVDGALLRVVLPLPGVEELRINDLGKGVMVVVRGVAHEVRPRAEEEAARDDSAGPVVGVEPEGLGVPLQLQDQRERRAAARGVAPHEDGGVAGAALHGTVKGKPYQGLLGCVQDGREVADGNQGVVRKHHHGAGLRR